MKITEFLLTIVALVVLSVAAVAYFLDNPQMETVDAQTASMMAEIDVNEAAELSAMRIAERAETSALRVMLTKTAYGIGAFALIVLLGILLTVWGITAIYGKRTTALPVMREVQRGVFVTEIKGLPMLVDTFTGSAVPLNDARAISEQRARLVLAMHESDNKRDALIGVAQGTNDPTVSHYMLQADSQT